MTATSADTVTMASPAGWRASAPSTRPNASCVDMLAGVRLVERVGDAGHRRRRGRPLEQRRQAPDQLRLGAPRREAGPLLARARCRARRAAPRSGRCVRSAVWFMGSPASGRPQPLMVWARMTLAAARDAGPPPRARRGSARGRGRRDRPPARRSAVVVDRRRAGGRGRDRSRQHRRSPAPCAPRPPAGAAGSGTRRTAWCPAAPRRRSPPGRAKSALQARALAQLDDVPADRRGTSPASWRRRASGTTRSRLWRLTSTIHSTLPSRAHDLLGQRLPHVALVQLGVADHHDEALGRRRGRRDRRDSAWPGRRTWPRRRRAPSSPSRDRRPPGSCGGSDRPAGRRSSRSARRSSAPRRPRRYWIA